MMQNSNILKPKTTSPDPFAKPRQQDGVLQCPFHGETITMLLRHADVRAAAADYKTYSSDAPFRVPIPSEEAVRTIRQLPIETDPPLHTRYRALTDPFFHRAKSNVMIEQVGQLVDDAVRVACEKDDFDAIGDFAIAIQSKALARLLKMPDEHANRWIAWGIHVFKVTGGTFKQGNVLEDYLHEQFERAEKSPGDDFFSALANATIDGRKLTRDECMGFGNLVFAGGRDTIIHTITSILAFLAWKPAALEYLKQDTSRINLASEEFFRVFMPLTQIGRVCPAGVTVHGVEVAAGDRIGLCWASANHDETVFESPEQIRLDRRPNPHVSFGFREHLCQGAAHARLVIRALLAALCEQIETIDVVAAEPHFEREEKFTREIGYDRLRIRFKAILRPLPESP